MTAMLAPLLLIAVIIYVAYPLLSDSKATRGDFETVLTDREVLETSKDTVMVALKDIEMDYRMGKLSERDYLSLRAAQEQKAAQILQKLEKTGKRSRKRKTG